MQYSKLTKRNLFANVSGNTWRQILQSTYQFGILIQNKYSSVCSLGREEVHGLEFSIAQRLTLRNRRPVSSSCFSTHEFCYQVQIMPFEWPSLPHLQSDRTVLTISLIFKALFTLLFKNSEFYGQCFSSDYFSDRSSFEI